MRLSFECSPSSITRFSIESMNRASILALLHAHSEILRERYGARHLALFGSAARDEMRPESDVDVLVEFEGATTYGAYLELKDFLEQMLNRPVDLVTRKGLKPRARQHVDRDLIRVT